MSNLDVAVLIRGRWYAAQQAVGDFRCACSHRIRDHTMWQLGSNVAYRCDAMTYDFRRCDCTELKIDKAAERALVAYQVAQSLTG